MNRSLERRKDLIGGILFISLIIILIVGGFFLTRYLTSDKEKDKALKKEINQFKIDEEKELIYFENEEAISDAPDIIYKDVVINLKEADTVNELLKKDMDEIRKSVKKTSENPVDTTKEILFDNSEILSAKERNYASYESANYLSLVVTDSNFDIYTGSTITNQASYIFSLTNGKRLSNDTLLGYNNLTIDMVKEKIRVKLSDDQLEMGEENTILIDDTINAITTDNAVMYVSRTGKLCLTFIVKTTNDSYNDSIELN